MDQAVLLVVDDDATGLGNIERDWRTCARHLRRLRAVAGGALAHLDDIAAAGRRGRARHGRRPAPRHERRRAARRGRPPPPARPAGAADRVRGPGPAGARRGHLRRDRARSLRPAPLAPRDLSRRAVPPDGLDHAARLGRGAARGALHDPRRRRVLVGPGLRAARSPQLRGSAQLLPRRLRRRSSPRRVRPRRGGAAAHGAAQRRGWRTRRPDRPSGGDRRTGAMPSTSSWSELGHRMSATGVRRPRGWARWWWTARVEGSGLPAP